MCLAPSSHGGLAIKETAPTGKPQKSARGCPQGAGDLLGHGDRAAGPCGLGHPGVAGGEMAGVAVSCGWEFAPAG